VGTRPSLFPRGLLEGGGGRSSWQGPSVAGGGRVSSLGKGKDAGPIQEREGKAYEKGPRPRGGLLFEGERGRRGIIIHWLGKKKRPSPHLYYYTRLSEKKEGKRGTASISTQKIPGVFSLGGERGVASYLGEGGREKGKKRPWAAGKTAYHRSRGKTEDAILSEKREEKKG